MLKVLIVDDEALVRAGICYRIPWKDFDMEVTAEAGSVPEAVEILQRDPTIDIVFTDIMMSGGKTARTMSRNWNSWFGEIRLRTGIRNFGLMLNLSAMQSWAFRNFA